jgi:hypothetical protein
MRVYLDSFQDSHTRYLDGERLEPSLNLSICEVEALCNDLRSMLDWLAKTGGLKREIAGAEPDLTAKSFSYGSAMNRP